MTLITEGRHAAEFLLSEDENGLSRDGVKYLAGSGTVLPGTILGKITASGKFVPHAPAAADGSQIAAAVAFSKTVVPADADALGVAIMRVAQVKGVCLTYNAATDTQAEKDVVHAALASSGLVVR